MTGFAGRLRYYYGCPYYVHLLIRVDYRLKRNMNFELDFGREISNRVNVNNVNNNLLVPNTSSETVSTFFSLGYRYNF